MIKIAFYIEHEWAFGNIHTELSKHLHGVGIDGIILSWGNRYDVEQIKLYDKTVDLYMSTPQGSIWLIQNFGINPKKILTVFHSELDLIFFKNRFSEDIINLCNSFGAVSKFLVKAAKDLGIEVSIQHLPLGINYDRYSMEPSVELKTIGYAGIYHGREEFKNGVPYDHPGLQKRSYLVKEIADELGLNFKVAKTLSYVTMPGFYSTIDCIICSSLKEGAGLPLMEAGAAGRLVLTTPVGHYEEKIKSFGGIQLPFDEVEFKETAKFIIRHYIENNTHYQTVCGGIKTHAKSYDWRYYVDAWEKFIKSSIV